MKIYQFKLNSWPIGCNSYQNFFTIQKFRTFEAKIIFYKVSDLKDHLEKWNCRYYVYQWFWLPKAFLLMTTMRNPSTHGISKFWKLLKLDFYADIVEFDTQILYFYILCSVWMTTQRTIQSFTKWYKKKLIADMKPWKLTKNAAKIYIFALSPKNDSIIWIIDMNHIMRPCNAMCTQALS